MPFWSCNHSKSCSFDFARACFKTFGKLVVTKFCGLSVLLADMWPVVVAMARTYAPMVVLPAAGVVGFIGEAVRGWGGARLKSWLASSRGC